MIFVCSNEVVSDGPDLFVVGGVKCSGGFDELLSMAYFNMSAPSDGVIYLNGLSQFGTLLFKQSCVQCEYTYVQIERLFRVPRLHCGRSARVRVGQGTDMRSEAAHWRLVRVSAHQGE